MLLNLNKSMSYLDREWKGAEKRKLYKIYARWMNGECTLSKRKKWERLTFQGLYVFDPIHLVLAKKDCVKYIESFHLLLINNIILPEPLVVSRHPLT